MKRRYKGERVFIEVDQQPDDIDLEIREWIEAIRLLAPAPLAKRFAKPPTITKALRR